MRFVPVLMLLSHFVIVGSAAAQPAKPPRLDFNGDPLPDGAIARLGTTRFQVPDERGPFALSPDGTTVVSANGRMPVGTQLDFLDTSTGKSLRKLDLPDSDPHSMQFTSDGKTLVLASPSSIKLVDAQTGKVVRSMDSKNDWDSSFALTAEGDWVAVQQLQYVHNAPVTIWDTKTGKEVASLPGRGASCKGLAFSPDGKRLLLNSRVPTQVDASAPSMSFGPDVALACIDVPTQKIVGETTVGIGQSVVPCPDGETVAIEAGDRQSVHIRHLPTGVERCIIRVKRPSFVFAPDGKTLFTVDESGQGTLWDAIKGDKIRRLDGALVHVWGVRILGISKDGGTIAVLDGDRGSLATVVVWNAATGKRVSRPTGHEGAVTCLTYAPDGQLLASGSLDKTVRLWNPATGEHLRILTVHEDEIRAIAISPDGKLLASSSNDGEMRLSNVADGQTVAAFRGPDKGAVALTFSREGTVLFAGGYSPEVLGWEIPSGKEVVRFKTGDYGAVRAFGNGGALALIANGGITNEEKPECLQVWNSKEQKLAASITFPNEPDSRIFCHAAIFTEDARMIASCQIARNRIHLSGGFHSPKLRVWERLSGQLIRTLAPTVSRSLAFSPNGRLLACRGVPMRERKEVFYGNDVAVWDVLTGELVGTLPVTPEHIAFSPDGLHLATGGPDNGILIWETPTIQRPKQANVPSAVECEAWWTALSGDTKDAYQAIGQMIAAPEQAVALLKDRVTAVPFGDPDTVAKLIVQLDSESFTRRTEAQQALDKMGEGASHLITKALQGNVSLEARRRLEDLLSQCDETSSRSLQQQRAIASLEWIGTPAARALLRTLADGLPRARLTMEARAALKRLQR
jgi:WD40 repeat protein